MNGVQKELRSIARRNGGVLRAADVVEFARNPRTHLHSRFTWDNTDAAQKWRLHEARNLIRVSVEVIEDDSGPVKVFVSLKADRQQEGGGYRTLRAVMIDPNTQAALLEEAAADAAVFREKWKSLKALVPVFEAMDAVFTKPAKRAKSA